jgi:(p)ppGpp synthase/HD superfamily hydrolase
VHTDVGHHCVGAKVNGKIVPLEYQLKNGDIVEILTNKASRPSLDWLSIVRTGGAKHKIKQWFRKERKEENTLAGQEHVEQELSRAQLRPDLARGEFIEKVAKRLNYNSVTDLFAAVGFGDVTAATVVTRLKEESKTDNVVDIAALPRPATTQLKRHPHRRRRRRAGAALEVLQSRPRRSDHGLRHDRPRRLRASRRLPEHGLHERRAGADSRSRMADEIGADARRRHRDRR